MNLKRTYWSMVAAVACVLLPSVAPSQTLPSAAGASPADDVLQARRELQGANPAPRPRVTASPFQQDSLSDPDVESNGSLYTDLIDNIRQTTGRNVGDVLEMSAPRSLSQRPSERYAVGVGDRIEVQVWGSINGQYELTVDSTGSVFIPQIGRIQVQGVRLADLSKTFEDQLSRQFKSFSVRATVAQARTINVQVSGNGRRVGLHSVPSTTTMLGAALTFSSPTGLGSRRFVELWRAGARKRLDLYCLFRESCNDLPEQLLEGDVLHVPLRSRMVAIYGPVGRPGIYELAEKETADDLMRYAGGLSIVADPELIHLYRFERRGMANRSFSAITAEDLCRASDARSPRCVDLRDGDFLDLQPKLPTVSGVVTVLVPGADPVRHQFQPGLRLLDIVNGPLVRLLPRRILTAVNNPDFLGSSTLDERITRLDLSSISILRFDAFKREYTPVRVDALAAQRDGPASAANVELQDGDLVLVDQQSEWKTPREDMVFSIRILGEVKRPGTYRLAGTSTLRDAVSQAGGTTERAALWSVLILRLGDGRAAINKDIMEKAFSAIRNQQRRQEAANSGRSDVQAPPVTAVAADALLTAGERRELAALQRDREMVFTNESGGRLDMALPLKPNDIILVPPEQTTVACYGAFFRTGQFSVPEGGLAFASARDRCGVISELDPTIYLISARESATCRDAWYRGCPEVKGGDVLISVPSSVGRTGTAAFADMLEIIYKTAVSAATLKLLF